MKIPVCSEFLFIFKAQHQGIAGLCRRCCNAEDGQKDKQGGMSIDRNHLKADFEQLCVDGKVSAESLAVITSLFLIVELILAVLWSTRREKQAAIQACRHHNPPQDQITVSYLHVSNSKHNRRQNVF